MTSVIIISSLAVGKQLNVVDSSTRLALDTDWRCHKATDIPTHAILYRYSPILRSKETTLTEYAVMLQYLRAIGEMDINIIRLIPSID